MSKSMRLVRFRVRNFRSVEDSNWIDVNSVTALIGANESGKSNLLLPLWKLNPAQDGEISPTSDFPRKRFSEFRAMTTKPIFIEADFTVGELLKKRLSRESNIPPEQLVVVRVMRRLDGEFEIDFPNVPDNRSIKSEVIQQEIADAQSEISTKTPLKSEVDLATGINDALKDAYESLHGSDNCGLETTSEVLKRLSSVKTSGAPKTSSIVPIFERLHRKLSSIRDSLSQPHPRHSSDLQEVIIQHLPSFVYYSNYGNLDSEIYLPHVIENLSREDDLGQRESAKARTLKVLFEFVNLQPKEILELGRDLHAQGQRPTDEQVEHTAEKKKERSILLQSASTRLTEEFRRWWRQGDYRFRFEADGDHFRIWVADDRRPEEVELEGRSTGLQWFLSFYLVFLVESEDAHSGCILLLDEPGHSLHPLAQRDLSDFFDGLSKHNQLIYTTHSPFLVDADRLDRARKVFVDEDGTSRVTSDLGADDGDPTKRGAGYAVHAALGLTVAESLLVGCDPIVVEGPSDQHYLTTIKTLLIASGRLNPSREIVFPPAGGAKGVKAIASILGSKSADLPVVLLDSDYQGTQFASNLRESLYVDCPDRVLEVGSFVDKSNAEVEDLIPHEIMITVIDRMIREPELPFSTSHNPKNPIVPQIEAWASSGGAHLSKGWKVELAKRVKRYILEADPVKDPTLEAWLELFKKLSFRRESN